MLTSSRRQRRRNNRPFRHHPHLLRRPVRPRRLRRQHRHRQHSPRRRRRPRLRGNRLRLLATWATAQRLRPERKRRRPMRPPSSRYISRATYRSCSNQPRTLDRWRHPHLVRVHHNRTSSHRWQCPRCRRSCSSSSTSLKWNTRNTFSSGIIINDVDSSIKIIIHNI